MNLPTRTLEMRADILDGLAVEVDIILIKANAAVLDTGGFTYVPDGQAAGYVATGFYVETKVLSNKLRQAAHSLRELSHKAST